MHRLSFLAFISITLPFVFGEPSDDLLYGLYRGERSVSPRANSTCVDCGPSTNGIIWECCPSQRYCCPAGLECLSGGFCNQTCASTDQRCGSRGCCFPGTVCYLGNCVDPSGAFPL